MELLFKSVESCEGAPDGKVSTLTLIPRGGTDYFYSGRNSQGMKLSNTSFIR